MLSRQPSSRRSVRTMAARATLAAVATILAGFALADSFAHALARSSPSQARVLAPWDGKIAGKAAERAMNIAPVADQDSQPARLARAAIALEPTSAEAFGVLGMQAQLRSQTEEARILFAYSLKLSRRELPPRLWAIEEAVGRGDLDQALRHYDIALRTSDQASARLFPPLASALDEQRVRQGVVKLLAANPPWREGFISYAARAGTSPRGTAALFRAAEANRIPVSPEMRTALVDSFANQGLFREAWSYYASIRPGAQRNRSRDPRFTFAEPRTSLFDWTTGEFASLQQSGDNGVVGFFAPPATGGTLVSQAQLLPPGRYTLQGKSSDVDLPDESLPYWTLTCAGDRELGRVVVPPSATNGGRFRGQFLVPAGCPWQMLSLVARPTDDYRGVTGQIETVVLEPAR